MSFTFELPNVDSGVPHVGHMISPRTRDIRSTCEQFSLHVGKHALEITRSTRPTTSQTRPVARPTRSTTRSTTRQARLVTRPITPQLLLILLLLLPLLLLLLLILFIHRTRQNLKKLRIAR